MASKKLYEMLDLEQEWKEIKAIARNPWLFLLELLFVIVVAAAIVIAGNYYN